MSYAPVNWPYLQTICELTKRSCSGVSAMLNLAKNAMTCAHRGISWLGVFNAHDAQTSTVCNKQRITHNCPERVNHLADQASTHRRPIDCGVLRMQSMLHVGHAARYACDLQSRFTPDIHKPGALLTPQEHSCTTPVLMK